MKWQILIIPMVLLKSQEMMQSVELWLELTFRDRDMESVVHDIQEILTEQLNLPPGYYLSYGGQFENLEQAKSRLLTAVPIALVLIFILLYIAFGNCERSHVGLYGYSISSYWRYMVIVVKRFAI